MTNNSERHFVFILASSRNNGNSEQLARYAAQFLPADAQQTWLHLNEFPLPAFIDQRHEGDGSYPVPQGALNDLLQATLAATDLVFVTPLYWYSLPTSAKLYLDHWSGWMRVPELNFRKRMHGVRLWNITVSSDQDQSYAQPLLDSLRITAGYMEMPWQGSLIGYGNRPGDVMEDIIALQKARGFFVEPT